MLCVMYLYIYISIIYYEYTVVHAVYRPHTYIIILTYDVYTLRGINHVIGLRKFIQSSTVDLCEPLGAKMFFLFILTKENITSL